MSAPATELAAEQLSAERPAWIDVCYGSTAGMMARFYEHPLDLVKVRLQSQPIDRPPRFKGPLDCFIQTLRYEGPRGLYRGLSMPILGAMAENATLFVFYNQTQQLLKRFRPQNPHEPAPWSHLAISGAAAGVATSFVLTPVELVKCRMQVQMIAPISAATLTSKPPGPISIAAEIVRGRGLKGLWLGQTGTFWREAGGSMAWFLSYEYAVRKLVKRRQHAQQSLAATKHDLGVPELMAAGALAGAAYTVVLFPADSIKSTVQTAALLDDSQSPKGFMQTGREMVHAKGWRGLYAGCGVTIIKSAGSSAIIFTIYSVLERYFDR